MRIGLLLAVVCFAPVVFAGDEVDYSAPYLVVEDGKLVAKYPGQEHEARPSEAGDASAGQMSETAGYAPASVAEPWLFTAGVLAVLVGGLAVVTRREPG